MFNLLKTDFKRIFKDKLLIIMGILGVVFALVNPILYKLIFSGAGEIAEAMFENYISSKTHFFEAFSLSNDFGLIVPILLAIALCKDFSFGTVRNKIISGKKRWEIFLSLFVVCFTVLWCVILIHALLTLSVSLIFFDFQSDPFTGSDFLYLLTSLGFELLVYIYVAAIISWLCVSAKNVGIAIVLYVAAVFGFTMISGILSIGSAVLSIKGDSQLAIDIIDFFQRINVFYTCSSIGQGSEYALKDVLYYTSPPIIGTGAFLGLGLLKFNKKDLK